MEFMAKEDLRCHQYNELMKGATLVAYHDNGGVMYRCIRGQISTQITTRRNIKIESGKSLIGLRYKRQNWGNNF
jgi:hypothetical protein